MKKSSLIFAALILAMIAKLPAQPDLIARIHFAGADQISADPNRLAFTNLFCSAEARALESQTLDRLSRAPGVWFKPKLAAGAGDGAAALRPLLDDLLKSEWILEMRDPSNGPPEYALAVRLNDERAQLWSKNLAAILQSWTGIGISPDNSGNWELKKHLPPDLLQFSRSGDWVVMDCGQDQLSLREQILPAPAKPLMAETNWLSADLDWPRLAQIFPALQEFDFPKIQMQAVGRDGNLRLTGKLALAQPLPALENWRLPAASIRQPLASFTAVRGAGPWLVKQPWMRPFEIQPQPDQLFIWALARNPFQTFSAEPVRDAKAALGQLGQRLSGNPLLQNHFMNPLAVTMTNGEISWLGMPFIEPTVQAVREPAGDFLVGGLFPNTAKARPLPPELLAALNQPKLVYYHWEMTAERLKELPQLSQLLLLLTRHEQLDGQSAAAKWLDRVSPALGSSVTEVTQTAPDEFAFQRTAPGGLTALELLIFANWLEAPKFPALDLRLPPPRVRPAQKPFKLLTTPPGMSATPHP
jgi:hypothetical protein